MLTVQQIKQEEDAVQARLFQSPEGVVLTVQPPIFARPIHPRKMFQSPEGVVLTVQRKR